MGYVIVEDLTTGELREGMVYEPRRPRNRREANLIARQEVVSDCASMALAAKIRASQNKSSMVHKTLASVVAGFAGFAKICNTFRPETFIPKGFEGVFDYAFSEQGLTSIGIGLGLLGTAFLFAKAASAAKDKKEYNIERAVEIESIADKVRRGGPIEYPNYKYNEDNCIGTNELTVSCVDVLSLTSGFLGGATVLNALHPESMPAECANLVDFAFSQDGLATIGVGLTFFGAAWIMSKVSSHLKQQINSPSETNYAAMYDQPVEDCFSNNAETLSSEVMLDK